MNRLDEIFTFSFVFGCSSSFSICWAFVVVLGAVVMVDDMGFMVIYKVLSLI